MELWKGFAHIRNELDRGRTKVAVWVCYNTKRIK